MSFEVGPLSRGRRLAGYQGLVCEPPEACLGVQECADAVTERLAAARRSAARAGR